MIRQIVWKANDEMPSNGKKLRTQFKIETKNTLSRLKKDLERVSEKGVQFQLMQPKLN